MVIGCDFSPLMKCEVAIIWYGQVKKRPIYTAIAIAFIRNLGYGFLDERILDFEFGKSGASGVGAYSDLRPLAWRCRFPEPVPCGGSPR
jgi:hypothetical protein